MDGRVVTVGSRGRLSARIYGDGIPVVAVHGIPGSASVWDASARLLADAGCRVLAPDLLGFGLSERPSDAEGVWIDSQVDALAEALDVDGSGPSIVMGHDYGMPTAVALASKRPDLVCGLVLAAGNLFTDTPIPFPLRAVALPVVGPLVAHIAMSRPSLSLMLRLGVGKPRLRLDAAVYLGDSGQLRTIRTLFATALGNLERRYAAIERALPSLRIPSVVLWGDRDPFFGPAEGRRAAEALRAELTILRDAGHFLPAERPHAFVSAALTVARVCRVLPQTRWTKTETADA